MVGRKCTLIFDMIFTCGRSSVGECTCVCVKFLFGGSRFSCRIAGVLIRVMEKKDTVHALSCCWLDVKCRQDG